MGTEIVFTPAKSFVCPYCDQAWPPVEEFAVCPCCREETIANKVRGLAFGEEEARKRAIQYAFGWYLYDTGQL